MERTLYIMPSPVTLADPALKEDIAKALGITHCSDKVARILDLLRKGVELETAFHLITGKTPIPPATKSHYKSRFEKWMLSSEKFKKLAGNVYECALKGKPIVGTYTEKDESGKKVKKTNVMLPEFRHAMAAAESIMARVDPVKGSAMPGITNIQVNIGDYENPAPVQAQDVVVEDLKEEVAKLDCK